MRVCVCMCVCVCLCVSKQVMSKEEWDASKRAFKAARTQVIP